MSFRPVIIAGLALLASALLPLGSARAQYAYISNSNSTVSVINTQTNLVVGSAIHVGIAPMAFGSFIGPPPMAA